MIRRFLTICKYSWTTVFLFLQSLRCTLLSLDPNPLFFTSSSHLFSHFPIFSLTPSLLPLYPSTPLPLFFSFLPLLLFLFSICCSSLFSLFSSFTFSSFPFPSLPLSLFLHSSFPSLPLYLFSPFLHSLSSSFIFFFFTLFFLCYFPLSLFLSFTLSLFSSFSFFL